MPECPSQRLSETIDDASERYDFAGIGTVKLDRGRSEQGAGDHLRPAHRALIMVMTIGLGGQSRVTLGGQGQRPDAMRPVRALQMNVRRGQHQLRQHQQCGKTA